MFENILVLCLDSVRYDTYVAAKTPNMDVVGKPRLVHSFACWTVPSIIGYLMGTPPIGTGRDSFIPGATRHHWAPKQLMEKGYSAAWLSTNPMINRLDSLTQGFFKRYWRHFINPILGDTQPLIDNIKLIADEPGVNSLFIFILLMDTHHPYRWADGERELIQDDVQGNFDGQVKSIEYVDSLFPQIIGPLVDTERPTRVTITSDHGELFGPHFISHNPASQTYPIEFDSKLFEIPLVEGIVEGKI